jgi:hypothetical protein
MFSEWDNDNEQRFTDADSGVQHHIHAFSVRQFRFHAMANECAEYC